MKKPMKAVAKAAGTPKEKAVVKGTPKPTIGADERRWRAEDAMRTIMRAEDHKKDSKLMSDVKKLAKEQAMKLKGLC